jgi:heterodisulfide reductase subunit A
VGSLVQKESIQADYVVLSAGLRPSQEAKGLAEVLGLEIDSNGFFKELHPELKPVETSRKGIYICGLAHSSQTAQDTITQAMAAARKASSGLHRV